MFAHTGKAGVSNGGSSKYSRHKVLSQSSDELNSGMSEFQNNGKRESSCHQNDFLWFGPKGNSGGYLYLKLFHCQIYVKIFPGKIMRILMCFSFPFLGQCQLCYKRKKYLCCARTYICCI